MIDLHIHTNHSDGTWTTRELLEAAELNKLEVISITDHDGLAAYDDLKEIDYKKIYSGTIIPGIEFSSVYDGIYFHFLAYDFEAEKLKPYVEKYYSKRPDMEIEFKLMYENGIKHGLRLDDNVFHKDKYIWPIDQLFDEAHKYEENKKFFDENTWNDVNKFFKYANSNKNFPFYFDMSVHYPTADITAKAVREAGGKTFIAHVYKCGIDNHIEFLDILRENNIIDGVECQNSAFKEGNRETLEEYCKKYNLLMSGGSDCHGLKKPDRKIGVGYDNICVEKDVLEGWNLKNILK